MRLLNTAPHDAVTELLATLRVRSTVYCLSELRGPGTRLPRSRPPASRRPAPDGRGRLVPG